MAIPIYKDRDDYQGDKQFGQAEAHSEILPMEDCARVAEAICPSTATDSD